MHPSHLIPAAGVALAAAASAALLALPTPAAAQSGQEPITWGVVPSSADGPDGRAAFEYKLDPGAELVDYLAISNHATEQVTVAVYASDAFTTADGGFDLLPSAEPPTEVGSWVTLDSPTLTVPGRSRVDVPFRLSVPDNATPGDHAGGLVASLTAAGVDEAGDRVQVEHRVGARIYLRVTGELDPAFTVERVDAEYAGTVNPFAGGAWSATYTIRNTGNVRLVGEPRVAVAGPFGWGRREAAAEPLPEILPGDAITTTVRLDGVAPLVRLASTVEVQPAAVDGQQLDPAPVPAVGRATVWALPWVHGLLLVLTAAALAGWWWLRRRRRRRSAAQLAAAVAAARKEGREEAEQEGRKVAEKEGRKETPTKVAMAAVMATALSLAGCAAASSPPADGLYVVVTTEILKDLAENIAGDRISVDTIVPPGGDPHSYEPTPEDATRVARADIAFTNHLLLEEHALIKMVDSNVPPGIPNISLAENAEQYGATLIPLVEDLGLDVIWLGLAVRGQGTSRTADVRLFPTELTGPGDFFLYITDALGVPDIYWDSSNGLDESDVAILPPGAHTHLNWAFTQPGEYELTLSAELDPGEGSPTQPMGTGTFRFAVGIDPAELVRDGADRVLADGHTDLAVDLDTGEVFTWSDPEGTGLDRVDLAAEHTIIDVPDRAIETVPDDDRFGFLGPAGTEIWELPQAVLGKHVHGQIDPHLWQDVRNAASYVQLMTDTLAEADPEGREMYHANRDDYLAELAELHDYVADQIAQIPPERRQLVTTHDAFAYLAHAYDMEVVGFVVPNPAQEPSAAQVNRLTQAVQGVPAVFLEPNLAHRANVLRRVAEDHQVEICVIYGEAFDEHTTTYLDMMRHNADELLRCLGEQD